MLRDDVPKTHDDAPDLQQEERGKKQPDPRESLAQAERLARAALCTAFCRAKPFRARLCDKVCVSTCLDSDNLDELV